MRLRPVATLLHKELMRFYKVSMQTLLAPVVTALLYLLIFSHVLSGHVQPYPGVAYVTFLIPGLVMMSVIQNAFANSSSSLIQSKITGNLLFVLLTPLTPFEFFLAFVTAATVRAALVGIGVCLAGWWFTDLTLLHPVVVLGFALVAGIALGALGVIAGLWADKFDELAAFQNFLVVPLSFLSGVFYSIHSLPDFWQAVSRLNPFFYMIDGFRYGFFGVSDGSPFLSLAVSLLFALGVSGLSLWLLVRGYKIRN